MLGNCKGAAKTICTFFETILLLEVTNHLGIILFYVNHLLLATP